MAEVRPTDELLTARLSLRRPESSDAAAVLAVHANPLACAHNPADALTSTAEAEAIPAAWGDGVATEAATEVGQDGLDWIYTLA